MCVACYATASVLAASLWPHAHGRTLFVLADAAAEDDEEEEQEADSAARAAAEADGFFAGASPRQLAPAFAAQRQRGSPGAAAGGEDCVLAISAAVDAMQATDKRR